MLKHTFAINTLSVVKNSDKKRYNDSKLLNRINSRKVPQLFKVGLNYASRKSLAGLGMPQAERLLWRMVLLQAFEDCMTASRKPEARTYKRQAMAWIFTDNADFFEVCCNSDVDPKRFRDFVFAKLKMKNLVQVNIS
jgi:hypothetical protein